MARFELAEAGIVVSTLYPFVTDTEFYGAVENGQNAAKEGIKGIGSAAHSLERVAEKILGLIRTGESQDDLVPKKYGGSLETPSS